jgi:hypothetical protein
LYCVACGTEMRDLDSRPRRQQCLPETWEVPENQIALFEMPKVRRLVESNMSEAELSKWEASFK